MTDTSEQLGEFLRSRRERLKPAQVGISDSRRRRTPGLRREEVASLAGISSEWYVKLEQGRAVAPSSDTINALACALQLDDTERAHLRMLARGEGRWTSLPEEVPATLKRLLDALPHPAYVTGLRWDMLAWNEAAAELFGGLDQIAAEDRNVLEFVLTKPKGRALFGEQWADEARRMVALFRATADLRVGDPAFDDLVARLRAGCPEFEAWWDAHDVAAPVSGTKHLHHLTTGRMGFDYTTLQANDDPRLKLVVYLPA